MTCIVTKAGEHLNKKDASILEKNYLEFIEKGDKPAKAAESAVTKMYQDIMIGRNDLIAEVKERGVTIPVRKSKLSKPAAAVTEDDTAVVEDVVGDVLSMFDAEERLDDAAEITSVGSEILAGATNKDGKTASDVFQKTKKQSHSVFNLVKNFFRSSKSPQVKEIVSKLPPHQVAGLVSIGQLQSRVVDLVNGSSPVLQSFIEGHYNAQNTHQEDPLAYFIHKDENGKPFIPENIVGIVSVVMHDWLGNMARGTLVNTKTDINQMFGRDSKHRVLREEYALLRLAGDNRTAIVRGLGTEIFKQLGIEMKTAEEGEFTDGALQARLESALGQLAVTSMLSLGYVKQNVISGKEYNALLRGDAKKPENQRGPKKGVTELDINFIRALTLEEDTDTVSDEIQQIIDVTNLSEDLTEKVFAIESVRRGVSFKPITKIVETLKRSSQLVPEKIGTALKKMQSVEWELKDNMLDVLDKIGEKNLRLMNGYVEDVELTEHVTDRESVLARNEAIVREVQQLVDFRAELNAREGLSKTFYFAYNVAKNGRFNLDNNTVNPQTSKIQRHFIGGKTWNVTVDSNEIREQFALAIVASFEPNGFKMDGNSLEANLAEFDKLVADPDIQAAIEAINGEQSAEGTAAIMKVIGTKGTHKLDGLVALAAYNPDKPFKANIGLETDGVTSGIAIGQLQAVSEVGADGNIDKTLAILAASGMPSDGADYVDHGTWASTPGNNDTYKQLANRWSQKMQEYLKRLDTIEAKQHMAAIAALVGPMRGRWEEVDGKMVRVPGFEDTITKLGRDMSKDPTMITSYGAGMRKVIENLADGIVDSIYANIKKNKDNPEKLQQIADNISVAIGLAPGPNSITIPTGQGALDWEMDHFRKGTLTSLKSQITYNDDDSTSYGSALESAILEQFGGFIKFRTEINKAFNIMFKAFVIKYNARVAEEVAANNNQPLSKDQLKEIEKQLQYLMPIAKGPLSKDFRDGVLAIKTKNVEQKGKWNLVKQQYNHKIKGTETKSISSQIEAKEYADPGVSGMILMIHTIDAAVIAQVLAEMDALGIHDADIFSLMNSVEGTELYNKAFKEINQQFSIIGSLEESIDNLMDHLKKDSKLANELNKQIIADVQTFGIGEGKQRQAANLGVTVRDLKAMSAETAKRREEVFNRIDAYGQAALPGAVHIPADAAERAAARKVEEDAVTETTIVEEHIPAFVKEVLAVASQPVVKIKLKSKSTEVTLTAVTDETAETVVVKGYTFSAFGLEFVIHKALVQDNKTKEWGPTTKQQWAVSELSTGRSITSARGTRADIIANVTEKFNNPRIVKILMERLDKTEKMPTEDTAPNEADLNRARIELSKVYARLRNLEAYAESYYETKDLDIAVRGAIASGMTKEEVLSITEEESEADLLEILQNGRWGPLFDESLGSINIEGDPESFADIEAKPLTADNLTETFDSLPQEGIDSTEHTARLTSVLDDIVADVVSSIDGLELKLNENSETTYGFIDKNNAIYMSVGSGTIGYNTNMSAQEVLVHELVHGVTRYAIESDIGLRNELRRLFDRAEKVVTYKDFLNHDKDGNIVYIDEAAEIVSAKEQYAYIFGNKDSAGNYLHEFMAYGLTNENFVKKLSDIESFGAREKVKGNLYQRIAILFNRMVLYVSGRIYNTADVKVDSALQSLATKMGEAHKRSEYKAHKFTALEKRLNTRTAKTIKNWVAAPIEKFALKQRSRETNIAGKVIKIVGMMTSEETSQGFDDAMSKTYARMQFIKNGFMEALVREFRGRTKDNGVYHDLLRMSKHMIDQLRLRIATTTTQVIRKDFKAGQPSQEESGALLRALVKTDVDVLRDDFSMEEIQKLMTDPAYRQTKIEEFKSELTQYGENGNYYINQTRSLGRIMAHGEALVDESMLNAYNIANMKGDVAEFATVQGDVVVAESIIERLATLYAMKETNPTDLKLAEGVIVREQAADSSNNGILTFLNIHKGFKINSVNKLFGDNKTQTTKGYTHEILDANVDIKVATLSAEAGLLAQGYKRSKRKLTRDTADTNPESQWVYTSTSHALSERMKGITSLTAEKHAGRSIEQMYMDKAKTRKAYKEIKAAKQIELRKQFKNPKVFSSSDAILVPILNEAGETSGHRYLMSDHTKRTVMNRDDRFDITMGKMVASIEDKVNTKEVNRKLVRLAKADYDQNGDKSPERFITLTGDSKNEEYAELYALMPKDMRMTIKKVWGNNAIVVRKDLLDLMFGYRKRSFSNSKMFDKHHKTRILLRHTGMIWEQVVRIAKVNIVIKNPAVLSANVISNTVLLGVKGVPINYMFKQQAVAIQALNDYQKELAAKTEAELRLDAAGLTAKQRDDLKVRIARMDQDLKTNPVHELIEEGIFQSIVEDISLTESVHEYKARVGDIIEPVVKKVIGQPGIEVAKQLYMTSDTKPFQLLLKATQYSDFVARFALYSYRTKVEKVDKGVALQETIESFINYDLPAGRDIQWVNDIGLFMFTKFLFRIQKIIFNVWREKPATALSQYLLQQALGDAPDISESFMGDLGFLGRAINPVDIVDGVVGVPLTDFFGVTETL